MLNQAAAGLAGVITVKDLVSSSPLGKIKTNIPHKNMFTQSKATESILPENSNWRWLVLSVAALAGMAYASFPLAIWLNARLAFHGEVSLLGEAGQPHAAIFNSLDVLSGILLTGLCCYLLIENRHASRSWRWAIWALGISGLGGLVAAILPLPTAFVFPDSFYALMHISIAVFRHGFASFINTGTFVLSTILWARIVKRTQGADPKRLLLAYSILAIVAIGPILTYILPATGDFTQRLFITLFAIWLVIFTHDALQTQSTLKQPPA